MSVPGVGLPGRKGLKLVGKSGMERGEKSLVYI